MIKSLFLLMITINLIICISAEKSSYKEASVIIKDKKIVYLDYLAKSSSCSFATYNDSLLRNGWSDLNIKAGYGSTNCTNKEIMYASGYLEGYLTAKSISNTYLNTRGYFFDGQPPSVEEKTKLFLADQDSWMRKQISYAGNLDALWQNMGYLLSQYDGLVDGYLKAAQTDKTIVKDAYVLQFLNALGDLIDITHAVHRSGRPNIQKMTSKQLQQYFNYRGMCSALVKLLPGFENIFMAHSSWFLYANTYRIYKHYDFNLNDKSVASKALSFSSYPGFLVSLDDFYIMDTKLVMLQTTLVVFNMSLYDKVTSKSLLAWHRVRLSNMMATDGHSWSKILSKYNSGTYNNQYMIIDLNKVALSKGVSDETLYVIEQLPGIVKYADQTNILRAGYWPSYNVPFYEKIYQLSGYTDAVKKHGINFSYQLASRAKIFRRDQGQIRTIDDMKKIMRYNDYQHDPYSLNDSCSTICCRGDLNPTETKTMGCYDSKVTDYNMAQSRKSVAINGPTLGNGLKPFSWSGKFANQSHLGLPTSYNFDWINTQPVF